MTNLLPLFDVDFPDPDIIRVDDTYYMLCTTMHFFPGCEILRSKDLLHWEHASYVYDSLDGTPGQKLEDGFIFGKGMWAASLRFHKGTFYICFVANDTHKTYLYRSNQIEGPWTKSTIEGFYHDCSLLFDDDDRIYIAYGNRSIYITELNEEMTAPKEGGFHKMVIEDKLKNGLGFEGTHLYKINGTYYLFFIHSVEGRWFRTEACYHAASLDGEFVGGDVFADDGGYRGAGIAQGAIVDTPNGDWYAILFQDRGGSGRIPYIIPMHWDGTTPVIGDNGKLMETDIALDVEAKSGLVGSDDFKTLYETDSCFGFNNKWQFNHEPKMELISRDLEAGSYSVTTDCIVTNPTLAKNSLTQRMSETIPAATVTVDGSKLKLGDYAGLMALQFMYGFIGLRKEADGCSIVYAEKVEIKEGESIEAKAGNSVEILGNDGLVTVIEKISTSSPKIKFTIQAVFGDEGDKAYFSYDLGDGSGCKKLDVSKDLPFRLQHFCGYRYALTCFATKEIGGTASFSEFIYE